MSDDRPETLEETQRRLAGYSNPRRQSPPPPPAGMQPPPPPAGLQPPPPPAGLEPPPAPAGLQPPPPTTGAAPASPPAPPAASQTPYGPIPVPPPVGYSQPGYGQPGYGSTTADPYRAPAAASSSNSRNLGFVIGAAAIVIVIGIVIAVVVPGLFSSNNQAGPPAPVTTTTAAPAPSNSGDVDWAKFPGSAYRDDDAVLAQVPAAEVRDTGEAILQEYRDELTSELGITWVEEYPGTYDTDINGYGEESMLYYYESASWLGEASAATPEARQQVMDAFERITAKYNVGDFYRANDVYQSPDSQKSFGAEKVEDQALWRFSSRGGETLPIRVGSSVWDRTLPTDPSFTDASGFYLDDSDDGKLYVVVSAYAYALLAEEDRDAFIEALKPYEGLTKPDSN